MSEPDGHLVRLWMWLPLERRWQQVGYGTTDEMIAASDAIRAVRDHLGDPPLTLVVAPTMPAASEMRHEPTPAEVAADVAGTARRDARVAVDHMVSGLGTAEMANVRTLLAVTAEAYALRLATVDELRAVRRAVTR